MRYHRRNNTSSWPRRTQHKTRNLRRNYARRTSRQAYGALNPKDPKKEEGSCIQVESLLSIKPEATHETFPPTRHSAHPTKTSPHTAWNLYPHIPMPSIPSHHLLTPHHNIRNTAQHGMTPLPMPPGSTDDSVRGATARTHTHPTTLQISGERKKQGNLRRRTPACAMVTEVR